MSTRKWRPTEDELHEISLCTTAGLNDTAIAVRVGISLSTFQRYKQRNPKVKAAVARGRLKRQELSK